jgi:alanyl-tRNA synthetase
MRVITDHLRGATFLAVDGIKPSNKEQGYVMRRLLRRAIRFAFELGIEQNFLQEVVPVIVGLYEPDYPEFAARRDEVIEILTREEKVFRQTLRQGERELDKMIRDSNDTNAEGQKLLSGGNAFKLYDTFGYPKELTAEIVAIREDAFMSDDWLNEFEAAMAEQRARSQTAAKGTFKGGLGGQTLQHKKYHTATHLMYQALRDVLGDHVVQRGSNITEERLRFDFSHPEKVTPEQIARVEEIVNEQIQKDLKVSFEEYPTRVAIDEKGALGQFGDRYGDRVKVYKMIADGEDKPFSFEICGGPHVGHTLQLAEGGKRFKILKEEASSAGVRRIKAALV